MPSDTDFRVVPGALFTMVNALSGAGRMWNEIALKISEMSMQSLDLGLLGEAKDYPGRYNDLKEQVYEKLNEGVAVWHDMANALNEVAETYLAKDAEWYEQFGYIDKSQD